MESGKIRYRCGHESELIILDDNPLSITAYEEWRTSVGFDGDRSKCFNCFCSRP